MMPVNPDPPPRERFLLSPSYRSRAGASPSSAAAAVPPLTANSLVVSEDPNKKIRKAYTISKSRESWTEQEHDKFLEALQLFDRDWKKIEAFVGSKTVIQIRSHAQKYFLKAQKNGTTEHVPPPRPKRKAAHPYPQKASKSSSVVPQAMESFQSSPPRLEPKYVLPDSSPVSGNSMVPLSSHTHNRVTNFMIDNDLLIHPAAAPSYSFTAIQNPRTWPYGNANDLGNSHSQHFRVPPDFAQVYSFIGSIFDPDASDQLQKLKKMDPINVETVLVLMKNLTINLSSPAFEDHRRLLSSNEFDLETA